jgi:predicted DNA-binding transcriptional regulator YafY
LANVTWSVYPKKKFSRELVLDILRFGLDVEVLEPQELREEVKRRLRQALGKYQGG